MDKSIIIFGASNFGKLVYKKIRSEMSVIGFCDNDELKWGGSFLGKPVFSLEEMLEYYNRDSISIIIASSYRIEIIKQFIKLRIKGFYSAILNYRYDQITKKMKTDIEIKRYSDLDFLNLEINPQKIGLIVRNHSGSNTLALWNNLPSRITEKYEVEIIYDSEDEIEYYKKLYECKILVTTHSNNLTFFKEELDSNRIFIQLWHGPPMKGVGRLDKSNPKVWKDIHNTWGLFNKITSYSSFVTTLMSACFMGSTEQFEITGAPRNDYLFDSNGKRNLTEILEQDISDMKIVYFMPTFRLNKYHINKTGGKKWNNIFGFNQFNQKQFSRFLIRNKIMLIVKMHPYEEDYVKEIMQKYEYENVFLYTEDKKNKIDFYETLNASDLLITDYSSVFYDYLLLDKPIIFTPIDLQKYKENPGILYGPYEEWTPGPKVTTQDALESEILESLEYEDKYKNEREAIRKIFHYFNDNNSSKRVWDLIESTIEENDLI